MITIKGNIIGFRLRGEANIIEAITENDRRKMIKENTNKGIKSATYLADCEIDIGTRRAITFLFNQSRKAS